MYISAFSGIGGLDLGHERAGFQALVGIEKDAAARHSLARNRPGFPLSGPQDVNNAARELHPGWFGMQARDLALVGQQRARTRDAVRPHTHGSSHASP